jgi:hypothetical protein
MERKENVKYVLLQYGREQLLPCWQNRKIIFLRGVEGPATNCTVQHITSLFLSPSAKYVAPSSFIIPKASSLLAIFLNKGE